MILGLYVVLGTACWYLGVRAKITEWLWSNYPDWLTRFMDCPACVGFWWGTYWAGMLGWRFDVGFLGLPGRDLVTMLVAGLACIVLVPVMAGLMQQGFEHAGSVVPDDSEEE